MLIWLGEQNAEEAVWTVSLSHFRNSVEAGDRLEIDRRNAVHQRLPKQRLTPERKRPEMQWQPKCENAELLAKETVG